ncbi:hypothetical protein ACIRYZ_18180 [Kitasatospora sp. NPDC101155]|uniref:hypothetical protein n=1 Tax=Kitasatospora sp. NPDC101155 TaxID=3364097 RepID=UPI0038244B12
MVWGSSTWLDRRRSSAKTQAAPHPRALRLSGRAAVLAPLALLGAILLGSNPDLAPVGLLPGVAAGGAVLAVLAMLQRMRLVLAAFVIGAFVLFGGGDIVQGEVLLHWGVPKTAKVTAMHSYRDENDNESWRCEVQANDGPPLSHTTLWYPDCTEEDFEGELKHLTVDPSGWVGPQEADRDMSGVDLQGELAAAGLVALGVLILWARHKALRFVATTTPAEGSPPVESSPLSGT